MNDSVCNFKAHSESRQSFRCWCRGKGNNIACTPLHCVHHNIRPLITYKLCKGDTLICSIILTEWEDCPHGCV